MTRREIEDFKRLYPGTAGWADGAIKEYAAWIKIKVDDLERRKRRAVLNLARAMASDDMVIRRCSNG